MHGIDQLLQATLSHQEPTKYLIEERGYSHEGSQYMQIEIGNVSDGSCCA